MWEAELSMTIAWQVHFIRSVTKPDTETLNPHCQRVGSMGNHSAP